MKIDFFVSGNEYIRDSLNLEFIPRVSSCSDDNVEEVILSGSNQDLNQSYLAAKNFFKRVEPKSVKFVLISLSPYAVLANDKKSLVVCTVEEKVLENYFKLCLDNGAKPVVFVLPVHPAVKKLYKADSLKLFRDMVDKVANEYKANFIDLLDAKISDNCFKDKTHLNSDGSAAVSALLGAKLYFANIFSVENILRMDNKYFEVLAKYFSNDYKKLIHHIFCCVACDDFKRLSKTLPANECKDLMAHVFSEMTYDHLSKLSSMLSKDDYNDVAARIFEISAEKIRHKDKVKVGFYLEHSSKWCGDELYRLFERNPRFEPTVFLRVFKNELTRQEFMQDIDRFKSRGLNVFEIKNPKYIPAQDVLIQMSPYENTTPSVFRLINLKLTTLLTYIPYALGVSYRKNFSDWYFFRVLWKVFFASTISLKLQDKLCHVGMPRGVYSGHPKMDVFFQKDITLDFNWKLTRSDAKKIIWAPHHSVGGKALPYATFQWNYEFMYEFAKTHSEISWIVKPHPLLFSSAVREGLFPSITALEEYLQKWDNLPNAKVYFGAYYQAIFATSDGMIQDSGSFIAEYQYVDKPMIYLMREGNTRMMNDLAKEILKASYTVDGKDLEGIAAMMQRVFIEGDDYKAAERRAVFDKYLNYPKANGMLASEFIYKNIADELKEV